MEAHDIEIQRSDAGIHAYVTSVVLGHMERVLIWGVIGELANEYRGKTDEEIQQIAFHHWKRMNISIRRRRRPD